MNEEWVRRRSILEEILYADDASNADRLRALAELRVLEPETSVNRDMLSEVEELSPAQLVQELTEWLPEIDAAARMLPDRSDASEDEDARLAALVAKLRPDRRQLSWRQRRKLPQTSEALAELVEAAVRVGLEGAVREALAERAPAIAAKWVREGVVAAEEFATGAAGIAPAAPEVSEPAPDLAPSQEPTGSLPGVPDGIIAEAGWTKPPSGIRRPPPRRGLLG